MMLERFGKYYRINEIWKLINFVYCDLMKRETPEDLKEFIADLKLAICFSIAVVAGVPSFKYLFSVVG